LVDNDNTLWGETKNTVKAIIYFKLSLFENQKSFMKIDLDLAVQKNSEIKDRILELAKDNPDDLKIQTRASLLDK
jgi:hypothetical protein